MMDGNQGVTAENINEVILRLLKLKSGMEMDYQTYFNLIKKKLAIHRIAGKELPQEEQNLLEVELKRIWRIKDREQKRFTIKGKKTKVSRTPPPPGNDSEGSPKTSAIIKSPPLGKLSIEKIFNTPRVEEVDVKDVTEDKKDKKDNFYESIKTPLERINDTLDSILNTLINIDKENQKKTEKERIESESKRRKGREKELESKTFAGIKGAIKGILKPFQSIWDTILNFIGNIILGRIVIKLISWIADPENQGKIQSIIRFFSDHWPTLLALYLRFGTGIGRFIGKLGGILIKGAFRLGALAAKLAAKVGLKGAGKFARFLGGPRGRAIATGIGIAADVAVTAGTAIGIKNLMGGDNKEPPPQPTPTQQFSNGGFVRIPKFAGGGFANFDKMFGGFGFNNDAESESSSGIVKGPKGRDKVPAMLTDGEFVMSVGAVQKYGVETLESMNAAGGGTNQPQIVGGKTYAATGGLVGDDPRLQPGSRLRPNAKTLRFTTLWHGTSDIYKRMIESGGIDPKKFTFGALGEGFYTTPDKKIAQLYAEQAAESGGGKPAMVRLRVPNDVLKRISVNIRSKGLKLTGNELVQYSDRFKPQLRGNTRMSSMYVWGGRGQRTPEGFGPRIGNVEKGGLNMSQQYQAANLANKFGMGNQPPTVRSKLAPQRWRQRFVPRQFQSQSSNVAGRLSTIENSLDDSIRSNRLGLGETGFKLGFRTAPVNRMLPAAGESSANAMRAAEKASRLVREPIPASRAIVPYRGGGLVRAGVTAGLSESMPQIRTNMKIPGGFGNLKTFGVELLANYLVQKGIDKVTALMLANDIQKGKKLKGKDKEDYVERLRNVVDKEEDWQRGYGGLWDKIVGLGKETSSEKRSGYAKSILQGIGSSARQGGKIVGGYRLREQSFKEAPKTQIMTDDRGRPFVGYKSMRNGKLVYVRGSQPGGRTSNPLEAIGRMINPGAYKNIDDRNKRRQYEEASMNSISSLRSRGASSLTILRRQEQLNKNKPRLSPSGTAKPYRNPLNRSSGSNPSTKALRFERSQNPPRRPVGPPPRSTRRRPQVAGGGMNGRRGSGSNPSVRGTKPPSFSPNHSSRSTKSARSTLGINRR